MRPRPRTCRFSTIRSSLKSRASRSSRSTANPSAPGLVADATHSWPFSRRQVHPPRGHPLPRGQRRRASHSLRSSLRDDQRHRRPHRWPRSRCLSARAGNRRKGRLSTLRAHTKAPYKTYFYRKTLRALNRPRRARTVHQRRAAEAPLQPEGLVNGGAAQPRRELPRQRRLPLPAVAPAPARPPARRDRVC